MTEVRCGVVGSPIAHSRSPVLHRAAYAALGLTDWAYRPVELTAGELGTWLGRLDDSWRGLSVTMPLKHEALACADAASELATILGAANTLVRSQRGWHADNTDMAGVLGALNEASITPRTTPMSATIVGAGGTAAAALAAISMLGLSHADVVVRSGARAQGLLDVAERLNMTARVCPWPGKFSRGSALAADLVISTVPAAASRDLLEHVGRAGQTVVDVTYDPWPTALVGAVAARGAQAVGGASVLLWQAVAQFELMTGQAAPVDAMRAALLPGGNLAPP